jgi:hypothetical protein
MSQVYIHEDTQTLQKRLADLRSEKETAEREAQYATMLNIDLKGPINAANDEVAHLAAQIVDLEKIVERVAAGYPYCEKLGFELGVDACGEVATWEPFSELPLPGKVLGRDHAVVRLPVEVQQTYARALSSQRFDGFMICSCFEPAEQFDQKPEDTVRPYLFGRIQTLSFVYEDAIFLVDNW